jgi:hypothetical protein
MSGVPMNASGGGGRRRSGEPVPPPRYRRRSARVIKHEKGQVVNTDEISNLEKANAILQAWTRQHNRAGLLMAIPLVAGFVLAQSVPPALGNIAMVVGPAIALTLGLFLIPTDFRSRSGSLTPAICLVTGMWIAAVAVAVFSLVG